MTASERIRAAREQAVIAEIEHNRAHYQRRHDRLLSLLDAGRRDDPEEADYADGVRYGLDLALLILQK